MILQANIDFDLVKFLLDYGFIGTGILLCILMYRLISKAQKKPKVDGKLIKLIKYFFFFSIGFFLLSSTIEITKHFKDPGVTIEVRPEEPGLWEGNPKEFKWFNAQYKLAKDNFIELNSSKIKKGVIYQLLFFNGIDEKSIDNSKKRFSRMREFLTKMSKKVKLNENNIQVKIVRNEKMPKISYFLTERNNQEVAIYYLDELVTQAGEPNAAFQVNDNFVFESFKTEFDEYWSQGDTLKLNDILDMNIETDWFYR